MPYTLLTKAQVFADKQYSDNIDFFDWLAEDEESKVTREQFIEWMTTEGYVLVISENNMQVWDSEVKFVGMFNGKMYLIIRPKGFNPEESEDNPFDTEGEDGDDEEHIQWN